MAGEYTVFIRIIILIAILLGTVLEVLDTSIVNVAIPEMMGNLGSTIDQINWVSTGYILASVIVLPLTGWLSNHFGRRRYLAGSILIFTGASLLCGISTTLNMLVICRILQGIGGAALLSTAQATLIEVFPRSQLAMIQSIFAMGIVAAPTLGPTLGGFITDNYGWRWIFFINLPIGLLAAFLTYNFLHDSRYQTARTPIDLIGIFLLAVGLGSLQTLLEKGNREGWLESPLIIKLIIVAVVFLIGFIWWEMKAKYPAVKLSVLKYRSFTAGTLYAAVLGFGLYGGIFLLPVFLQEVQHFSALESGQLMMPGGFATAIFLPIVGRILGKVDPRYMIGFGTCLFILTMLQLQQVNINTSPSDLYLPLIMRGLALSCIFLPLILTSLAGLPPQEVGYASGLYNLTRQLGGSMGIAFLSTQLTRQIAVHTADLSTHVSMSDPITQQRLLSVQQHLVARGVPPVQAFYQSIGLIQASVTRQASTLAFENGFRMIAVTFILALPLLFILRRPAGMHGAPAEVH